MRNVNVITIKNAIKEMCIDANFNLGQDVVNAIEKHKSTEESQVARKTLDLILENSEIARNKKVPMCQDTGMVVVFVELGQEVSLVGGDFYGAINQGVREGYDEGFLRKSVVTDPLKRINSGDNTPAIIYTDIVPGDKVKLTIAPKGFGSENMSKSKMLKPSDGIEGVKQFVIDTVSEAGPNPCPPIVVGVGVGGTIDKAAQIAKRALTRPIGEHSGIDYIKELEIELLDEINKLGIGPQGFGGNTTAIAVNINTYATHIAGLPVVVNINCHAARHEERII